VNVAARLGPGDKVAPFELPDQAGTRVKLEDLLGKGPIVFFFYPADETPTCTREACSFRDAYADLQQAGAQVFGVSGDSVESHARFAEKHRLPYKLLADVGDRVRNDVFHVPKGLLGLRPGRATFVLDKDGVVRHAFQAHLQAQAHVDEAMAVVKRLAGA
jgi:peroxiredoxin Q/BCP